MVQTKALLLILIAGLIVANMPFWSLKHWFFFPLKSRKTLFMLFIELLIGYFLVGIFAIFLQTRTESLFKQGWEFYVITACLFAIAAFPSFVWRFLLTSVRSNNSCR